MCHVLPSTLGTITGTSYDGARFNYKPLSGKAAGGTYVQSQNTQRLPNNVVLILKNRLSTNKPQSKRKQSNQTKHRALDKATQAQSKPATQHNPFASHRESSKRENVVTLHANFPKEMVRQTNEIQQRDKQIEEMRQNLEAHEELLARLQQ